MHNNNMDKKYWGKINLPDGCGIELADGYTPIIEGDGESFKSLLDLLDKIKRECSSTYTTYSSTGKEYSNSNIKDKRKNDILLPKIIHEEKNDVYVAIWPDGAREVDILKPNDGETYDLEKGLLYYVVKHNLDLGEVLEWMRPILNYKESKEYKENKEKENKKNFLRWINKKDDEECPKELQRMLRDNPEWEINSGRFDVWVNVNNNGINSIYDREKNKPVEMIKPGFPVHGFLRYLIMSLYTNNFTYEEPKMSYYKLKKLTYKFYSSCFDSVEKEVMAKKEVMSKEEIRDEEKICF